MRYFGEKFDVNEVALGQKCRAYAKAGMVMPEEPTRTKAIIDWLQTPVDDPNEVMDTGPTSGLEYLDSGAYASVYDNGDTVIGETYCRHKRAMAEGAHEISNVFPKITIIAESIECKESEYANFYYKCEKLTVVSSNDTGDIFEILSDRQADVFRDLKKAQEEGPMVIRNAYVRKAVCTYLEVHGGMLDPQDRNIGVDAKGHLKLFDIFAGGI